MKTALLFLATCFALNAAEPTPAPLTKEQREAIKSGKPLPGRIDFKQLSPADQRLVFKHVTGKEMK